MRSRPRWRQHFVNPDHISVPPGDDSHQFLMICRRNFAAKARLSADASTADVRAGGQSRGLGARHGPSFDQCHPRAVADLRRAVQPLSPGTALYARPRPEMARQAPGVLTSAAAEPPAAKARAWRISRSFLLVGRLFSKGRYETPT